MTRDDAFLLFERLERQVLLHSKFLFPGQTETERAYFPAQVVYDTIRALAAPPLTEDELDTFLERMNG